ncbi:hypothetical protein ACFX10_008051 [Malus domestica]
MADIESPKAGSQVVYLFNTCKEHGTTLVVVILEAAILVGYDSRSTDDDGNIDLAKSRVVAIEKSDDIQRRYNDVIAVLHRRHGGWVALVDPFTGGNLNTRGLVQTLGHPLVRLKGNFSRESSFTTVDITDEIYERTTVEDDPSNSPFVMDPTIRYYAIGGRLTGVHRIYMTRCSQAFLEDLIVGTLIKLNRGWEHLCHVNPMNS